MNKKIFIIAGEASGDILGADLMKNILNLDNNISFFGVGGQEMQKIPNFSSLFDIKDIAVMGFVEVIKNLFLIKKRINQVVQNILSIKPDLVITIDAPGFNFQVVSKVKKLLPDIKFLHYVAPQVWAWKENRAKKVALLFDYLICFFDFEKPYFEKYNLKTFSVGHTSINNIMPHNLSLFLQKFNLNPDYPIVTILPGSRVQMAKKLLPIFKKVIPILNSKFNKIQFLLPTTSTSHQYILNQIQNWPIKPIIIPSKTDRYNAFFASNLAISISGTAVLEIALAKTPTIVVYRLSPISYFIAKHLVKIKNISLPNIIMGKTILPELIQNQCNPKNIADLASLILQNQSYKQNIIANLSDLKNKLMKNNENPSQLAAKIVLDILK